MSKKENIWIEAGYHTFAYEGPVGLKVERLANKVQKNKSSFYHYFADLEFFQEHLLKHHMLQVDVMAEKEMNCETQADLVDVIVEHKIDLLFNRQLRIHRENPAFKSCFEKTNEVTARALGPLWAKILKLDDQSYLAALVLKLGLENFYLQITDETVTHEWLNHYFEEFKSLVKAFKQTKDFSKMNGPV